MTQLEIQQKLTAVFRDVFDNPKLEITEKTTAKDVEGWDSIMHVNLIVAVETAFGVSFTTKDVKGLETVGDLMELIAKRAK